jgi:cytochrome c oxidase accessory protein FixG
VIGDGQGGRPWVYTAETRGLFRRIHQISGPLLILAFLVLPWVEFRGVPLLGIDLPARRLYLFGQVFTALDTRFLWIFLLSSALGLGFFTTIAGRAWCGYACPQTLFLDGLIRPVERWIEGERGQRRKRDMAPWTFDTWARKLAKWALFAAIAFALSMGFMGYFVRPLQLWTFRADAAVWPIVAVLTAGLFFDLAWFREQFCNYLCPYARVQSVLSDRHTWTVGYEFNRGEPRIGTASIDRRAVLQAGGCVDCSRCVTACPQGIDIRNGFQLECITCGYCIDACTEVMGKRGFPSLITYTTEARLADPASRPTRTRTFLYGGALTLLGILAVGMFLSRGTFDARVVRNRASYGQITDAGLVRNVYDAHIWNLTVEPQRFTIEVDGLPGASVYPAVQAIVVGPGEDLAFPVIVEAEVDTRDNQQLPFRFIMRGEGSTQHRPATFIVPRRRPS